MNSTASRIPRPGEKLTPLSIEIHGVQVWSPDMTREEKDAATDEAIKARPAKKPNPEK
jgi:hypothetical protein